MNKYPPEIAIILFHTMVQRPNMGLVEEAQHPLF
jgi:hypothetical protein